MSEEYRIQPFEMKNISPILDVVVPLWSPPTGDQNFKRFNVEYIIRNNFFENDLHYQLVDEKDQYCASAFFARKGEICKAADWFELESKKFSAELLILLTDVIRLLYCSAVIVLLSFNAVSSVTN